MSDGGMSDAEFDAKVGFPVGERYVPKSKLDAAEARATAAESDRDALLSDAVVEELALTIAGYEFWDEGSTIDPNAYRDTARAALTAAMATARAALTANHSAPVVEE